MKRRLQSVALMMLAIVLAISFVPIAPQTAIAEQGSASDALIAQMLASGNYVEGEAVAIVRSHANLEAAPQAQQLAEVGTDAVEAAAQKTEAQSAVGDEAALRVQSAQEDTLDVKLVVDHNRTTEQILRDLYADPDVISAEPNYITTELEAFDGESPTSQNATLTTGTMQGDGLATQTDAHNNPEDLTSLQWAMDSSLSTDANANTPISPTAGYSMNVPGWKDGRMNASAAANASGTVCVMDTGIDEKHPDLKNVLYQFTEEQQNKYNCGPYGYNASGDPLGTKYLRASGSHGTHVAGILAAQWNSQGVSGVAHGVKLISVSVFGGNGTQMIMSSVVKGFKFLVDISKETNLKVVNCSWGIKQPQFAIVAMVSELGKKGVNTIIAAGNDHENLDETIDFSSQTVSNPYAITVDSGMANGKTSEFSSYGQTSTEVFAPGSNHMSTIPTEMTAEVDAETKAKSAYSRYIRYYPQATAEGNRITYETFSGTSGIKVYNENPALNSKAKELATSTANVGYGDQRSLAVNLSAMNKQQWDMEYMHGFTAVGGYVYLAIPLNSAADANNVKWASVNVAMSDAFKPEGSLDTLTCVDSNGNPVEVDTAASTALDKPDKTNIDNEYKGWAAAASGRIYQTQWMSMSYNVDSLAGAYNRAHERMLQGEEFYQISQAGKLVMKAKLKDLGVIGNVYAWQPNGKTGQAYVIARIGIGGPTNSAQATADTKLYIDNVSLGSADAFTGAYELMSGTSMAAPSVAGALAVIAKDEKPNSQLTDAQLELRARERAATLLASVDYDDDLSTLCRTGGRVNLQKYAASPNRKAPLPQSAKSDGSTLTITGCFFGTSGSLAIDDKAVSPSSWKDGEIKANVSSLANGSHVAKITNSDGAVSRIVFAQSQDAAQGALPLYENTLATVVESPDHAKDSRLYGPLVGCGGYLFAQTATPGALRPEGLWRYDIAKNEWSRHALPAGYTIDGADFEGSISTMYRGCLVAYRDALYLYGSCSVEGDNIGKLWRYDPTKDSWEVIDVKSPGGSPALCVLGDDLFFVGGMYTWEFENAEKACAARIDVDKKTVTLVNAKTEEQASQLHEGYTLAAASANNIYLYQMISGGTIPVAHHLYRLTYDKAANTMDFEDLTSAFTEVAPPIEQSAEEGGKKAHVAFAGLPDGLAFIGAGMKDGSYVIGQDTHIIRDGSTKAETYQRTSSYHRAFEPLATYYDGKLYAGGQNATEAGAIYFRSTQYNVTPEPEATGGEVGKSYKVAGNTYKVKSNEKNTAIFTKAKNAKKVVVPATVVINGKTYKVVGIGAKAFASAKKKLKSVTIGKYVTTLGKGAFMGCAKLKKITGGSSVKTIHANAFKGCSKLTKVVIGKNVKTIGKKAFSGCKSLKKLIMKSKKLAKKRVKGSLKGSSVKTVKMKLSTAKANKTYAKKYAKFFTKANSGRKATVVR